MSASEPSLTVQLIWPFARVVGSDPASVKQLAREGILGPEFADRDTRVPRRVVIAMLERAIAHSGNAHLGLHAAEATESADLDPVDHAARSCATLRDALECLSRYFSLVDDAAELMLHHGGDRARLSYCVMHSLREPPAIAEFALARILLFIRRNAAADETGWEVWLSHPAPTDLAEHRRVLRLPLRFSAPENALVMPTSSLAAPMRHADVALAKSFAVRAKEMMAARAETADDVTHRVRRLVARQIASGTPSMAAVARQVGASVSTLRRRLSAEGTTFRRVTEDVRREVAEQELARGSSSCGEVASKLGFANVAAFHRAFRRWTGLAPSDYRRRHRI